MTQAIPYIKTYFTQWWIPIVGYAVPIGIYILGMLFQRDWIIACALITFIINFIGTLISSVAQIAIKRWYFIFFQIPIALFLFCLVAIIFIFAPPDFYGTHKTIPTDIVIEEPLESLEELQDFEQYDLVLIKHFQPGIYIYRTDYQPKQNGFFYIKAFEVISNDRLSKERMKRKSRVEVKNAVRNISESRTIFYEGEFTIYEGDWGDKYGSRMELWYQPFQGKEYKVTERNFIVEGWMR